MKREGFTRQRQRCDLVELCRNVLEELAAGTGSALTSECLDEPMEVEVDVDRLSQLLSNLFSNAHKYSTKESPTRVILQRAEQNATIMVRDIASPSQLGSGLYTSPKIPDRHGGPTQPQT